MTNPDYHRIRYTERALLPLAIAAILTILFLAAPHVYAADPWTDGGDFIMQVMRDIAPWALTVIIMTAGLLWWFQRLSVIYAIAIIGGSMFIFAALPLTDAIRDAFR